jgi:hypothetical protein
MVRLARWDKTMHWWAYGVVLFALASLLILSPAEATLGNVVKIVYLHGALERVAVLAFLVAAALGLAQVIWTRDPLARWTQAMMEVALLLWVAHFVVSLPAQILAWGGITLSEPRVVSATWIMVGTLAVYGIARWMNHALWIAFAAILNALVVLMILRGAVNVLHPFNPIFGSDSPVIILFYLAITFAVTWLALLLAYDRAKSLLRVATETL